MTITLAVLLGFALDWLLGDPKKFCTASFPQRLRH